MLRCRRRVFVVRQVLLSQTCRYSLPHGTRAAAETVSIPCGSNGSITLDIHHPTAAPSPSPTVAIFLPRGPLLSNPPDDASNVSILRSVLPCHVVQINYRWSAVDKFPTPIHDVMAGYDWIVSNFLPKRAFTRPGRSERAGRVIVCGELAGGQLATALALTECRLGEPGIVAANVNLPIFDWTELDELKGTTASSNGLNSTALLKQRSALFRKPQDYYDSFASPGLFFRSASSQVPGRVEDSPSDEMDELASLERMDFFREQVTLENAITQPADTESDPMIFRISTGTESPLLDQSMELAHVLRQSFERQAKSGELSHEDTAGRHAQYVEKPGLGLWDSSNSGRASILESAKWMAGTLAT
ncbi:unnamed protein product [Zymoseptoria tritici ST99CH_1A5]|uniref:Alpha/beta hydrolase fold-3 domain-containing protein n=2 Tax=Zymoseptoria tritici TaxID=1047171 RepID=A0A2H1GAE7_ZYMTR|nr:unnamed protein product [Zymoseptoria tritici ST99CH_1E4]SMY23241.1 unnamed protein product [Zymoseptoria tritici ST99CH_1A5]